MIRNALLGCLALFFLLPTTICSAQPPQELIILNWSDYLDPELIEKFEREHHAKVTEVYFASDEKRTALLLETNGRGYDLILSSEIDLPAYVQRGWVAPLDLHLIPNIRHIAPKWRKLVADAKEYAVPFFWGTVGIAYREDLVATPITSWQQIFRPAPELQGKIAMMNNSRDVIAMALKSLGFSLNSEDEQELALVRELLRAQKPFVHSYQYLAMDENSLLVKGDVVAAMVYNGDALMLAEHNDNIQFVLPQEGTNLYIDYFVVARHARNPALAHAFLDFINEPKRAAQMANFVYYATPNLAAEKFLDEEFLSNPVIYPGPDDLRNAEIFTPRSPRGQRLWHITASEIMH